uniref:DoxX family protein n=1 Tax=Cephaloticoccus sp. TaxID=1985742 RepID=UPI00404B6340
MNIIFNPNPIITTAAEKKSFTRFFPSIARYLLGLPLLVFGLNGFLNFIPQPEVAMPGGAMAFATALENSGYMMHLIGLTHLVVGLMLVSNRFVPLALALFAPFIVNSIAFHFYLERSGLMMSGVFLFFELYLAWKYRHAFAPMLAAPVKPAE